MVEPNQSRSLRKVVEWLLVLTVVATTLPFGGTVPLVYSSMEAMIFLAMAIFLVHQTRAGRIEIRFPIWFGLFLLLVLIQLIPIPSRWVLAISPGRLLGFSPQAGPSSVPAFASLSINPHDTLIALLKLLAYAGAFYLAAWSFDYRERKSLLLRGLIALACFESAYGVVECLTGQNSIFGYRNIFYPGLADGTYINHNHFAGFIELTFPLMIGLAFYAFQKWMATRREGGRGGDAEASAFGIQSLLYAFLVVFELIAIILSRSRGGILSALLTIALLAVLAQLRVRKKIMAVGLLILIMGMAGYAFWIGIGPALERFELLRNPNYIRTEGRLTIWHDAEQVWRGFPILGTGLGTFGEAYRREQTALVESYVDHAHNDYVEFAVETGAVGLSMLFLPIVFLLLKMISFFLDDSHRYRRSVVLGCIGSCFAILVHSFLDFNLQIPANALIFAVILGIGYKMTFLDAPAPGKPIQNPPLPRVQ